MTWEILKEYFVKYQTGQLTRKFLISIIKEYQYTNGIKVNDNRTK